MAKAAELKTSAVTNWLVDWLLALESSDLRETREGETGKRGTRTYIGMSYVGGEEGVWLGPTPTGGYKREQDPS